MMRTILWVVAGLTITFATSACTRDSEPQAAPQPQAAAPEAAVPEPAPQPEAASEPAPEAAAPAVVVEEEEEWVIWADGDPWDGPAPLTVEFECDLMEEVPEPKYEWDFGDGSPVSNEANPTHVYERPGHFTAKCRVTDPAGGVGEDSVVIEVEAPGAAPAPAAE